MTTLQDETMTVDELRNRLDEAARATVGLTVDEFVQRYRDGRLDLTSPTVGRLATIARLLLSTRANNHA